MFVVYGYVMYVCVWWSICILPAQLVVTGGGGLSRYRDLGPKLAGYRDFWVKISRDSSIWGQALSWYRDLG
jgi:hypothetical protein